MGNLSRKVEFAANVAIIIVAILLGSTLVSKYVLSPSPAGAVRDAPRPQTGSQLEIAGQDWRESEKTLVMVLSNTCRYCIESTAFYQRLAAENKDRGAVRLVAVMPQALEESSDYLKANDISVDGLYHARPADLQVSGTPTLILVDRTGTIIDSWVGKLPPEKENEVFLAAFGNPQNK